MNGLDLAEGLKESRDVVLAVYKVSRFFDLVLILNEILDDDVLEDLAHLCLVGRVVFVVAYFIISGLEVLDLPGNIDTHSRGEAILAGLLALGVNRNHHALEVRFRD